jgi:hypothetical protein
LFQGVAVGGLNRAITWPMTAGGFPMVDNEHVNRSAESGQFVKDSTVEREPSTTTTEHVDSDKNSDHEVNRSASTGKFVKGATVERHPETTETQQV